MKIRKNTKILFQGDSVTDCYRDRSDDENVGESYVKEVKEYLNKYNIKVINKAIAGNRVDHLLEIFENDFKKINPDYLVLLIGVNDTWHNYPNCKDNETFEKEFEELLIKITNKMHCKTLILEPFIIGYKEEYTIMKTDLNEKINIIKSLSKKYNCEYLSFINEFDKIITKENEEQYSIEGIHPLPLGYKIMADKIINSFFIEE